MEELDKTSFPSGLTTLYVKHIALLTLGCILGFFAAYLFNTIPFDFSEEIREARELGIVSKTVLAGYPKTRDILNYLSVLLFPLLFGTALWLLWNRRHPRSTLREIFAHGESSIRARDTKWTLCLVGVIVSYGYFSFNINHFYTPGYNQFFGAWILLGEEGIILSSVQSILSGGVFGKDFSVGYGPLLIYPLALLMKLLEPTIVVERIYKYLLDVIAYGIVIIFLYKTLRWKSLFVFSSVCYLFTFSAYSGISPNFTYLRVILGIVPILLTYFYFDNAKKSYVIIAGVVLGQSMLFSQEVGLCSVISVTALFLLRSFAQHDLKRFALNILFLGAGSLVSVAPLLLYLAFNSAIIPFWGKIYGALKLYGLGYASLPFPDFRTFIANPLAEEFFFPYWIVMIYIFALLYLVPLVFLRKIEKDDLLKLGLTIFGILLYRKALGRSSIEQVHFIAHPAFLLFFLFLDDAITGFYRKNLRAIRAGNLLMGAGLMISVFLLFAKTGYLQYNIFNPMNFQKKFSLVKTGHELSEIERGGIFFDPVTASSMMKIHTFLEENTHPDDYVYFFPGEAAYYFLFKRNNPTKYAISYNAATFEQRKDLVADLEKNKPLYVFYSRNTWRLDDIREDIQVPEVVEYLRREYLPAVDMGEILVMKRANM